ncbi:MAG: hypothetical protein A3J55_04450 [Candidatus Ryanbacteria bacterium RIFCSPHIGHO2_02_FULL_45_17b]|uniref:Tetratricopeptide repeat protein n=1 Tax=Candidatus Ryanbacteria bacterium RIFCSPHIGHO2_01_FULL_45_22 TaxID=1802114 RepID=A0A1G2G2C3_9BACT|nr:MAG: hypothetical protein A2719_05025 [Candidatus Ryanbacteria bacterium RIFCSPHIGHO2_01_FULL_45_22]OGZ47596.1 MAG: hypothetical protein A3J55_04450 [Candidatus Ryanbacteria bacterium RIFCSPHIGHO2_02_FULL_45_17b]
MRTGTISDIISYFFNSSAYKADIERALCQFFGIHSVEELLIGIPEFANVDSPAHRHFHEWFVFDFKLSDGKTPLQEWCEKNPMNIRFSDMTECADLLRWNEYGFFIIISSVPGKVEIESIMSKKRYAVREYKVAPFLKPKEVIVARISLIGQRYEFVSGMIEPTDTEFSDEARKTLTRFRNALTPKEIYHMWHTRDTVNHFDPEDNGHEWFDESPQATVAEATARLRKAMKACDILPFVSLGRVSRWIRTVSKDDTFTPMSLLIGLASDDVSESEVDELMQATTTLNNVARATENQASVGDSHELEQAPRFYHDVIEPTKWHPLYFRGVAQMQKGNFKKALTLFNQAFTQLFQQKTTTREVYRLFANKGVSMIALCDFKGRYFLELALKLNPRYDFARESLAKHDREFSVLRRKGATEEEKTAGIVGMLFANMMKPRRYAPRMIEAMGITNDPAHQYYMWLKQFGINFSRHELTPTKQIIIKGKHKT